MHGMNKDGIGCAEQETAEFIIHTTKKRPADVFELEALLRGTFPGTEYNIEGYPSEDFLQLVEKVRPSADVFERLIPNARKIILDDTGHVSMAERPQTVNDILVEFLEEEDAEEAPDETVEDVGAAA